MNILQKEGLGLTHDPAQGGWIGVQHALVRARQAELLAEATAERQAHQASHQSESKHAVRRQLGRAMVRLGRALADETPGSTVRIA